MVSFWMIVGFRSSSPQRKSSPGSITNWMGSRSWQQSVTGITAAKHTKQIYIHTEIYNRWTLFSLSTREKAANKLFTLSFSDNILMYILGVFLIISHTNFHLCLFSTHTYKTLQRTNYLPKNLHKLPVSVLPYTNEEKGLKQKNKNWPGSWAALESCWVSMTTRAEKWPASYVRSKGDRWHSLGGHSSGRYTPPKGMGASGSPLTSWWSQAHVITPSTINAP